MIGGKWLRLLLAMLLLSLAACEQAEEFKQARAYVVDDRAELIGGPKAVGTKGDVVIENDQIRLLINAHGTDPNITKYGGSLVDADIQRLENYFTPARGGHDRFVELISVFDLKTFGIERAPGSGPVARAAQNAVEILRDGSDGGDAVVKVSGVLTNILEIFRLIPVPLNSLPVKAETIYRLKPGKKYVEITTTYRLLNKDGSVPDAWTEIPLRAIEPDDNVVTGIVTADQFGDAVFFGDSLSLFGPGVFGFGSEWYLADQVEQGESSLSDPPTVEWIAGVGDDIGYALVADDGPIVFPLMESFLTIGFQKTTGEDHLLPAPGSTYTYRRYFIVDEGDLGGMLDQVIELKNWPSGRIAGHVIDGTTGDAVSQAKVLVFPWPRLTAMGERVPLKESYEEMNAYLAGLDAGKATARRLIPYSRFTTDGKRTDQLADGSFGGRLPVRADEKSEDYLLMAVGPGRTRSALTPVHLEANEAKRILLALPATGQVRFRVRSLAQTGPEEPVKVIVRGENGEAIPDPYLGEGFLPGSEAYVLMTVDGTGEVTLPAGTYHFIAGRGPEYTVDEQRVVVEPLTAKTIELTIDRVLDTGGWVATDFHQHTELSPDSGVSNSDRVLAGLVEGLDIIAGTDHDFVSNYRPALEKLGGIDRMQVMSGDELSHLSYGHFCSYPLKYDQTQVANGAPNWRQPSPTAKAADGSAISLWTPQDCFDGLRATGDRSVVDQPPIVIANHMRESITGYFRAFGWRQYSGDFGSPDFLTIGDPVVHNGQLFTKDASANFSWDFDGVEVLNSKRLNQFRTATVEEITESQFGQPIPPDSPLLPILIRTADEQLRIETGDLLLDDSNMGMLDDYLTLLAQGRRYVAVGDSDSHNPRKNETGKARTYIMTDEDEPAFVDLDEMMTNLKAGRAIATTGPFLEFWVDGYPIGADVYAPGGEVEVRIRAQAPPWMSFDRIEIYGNGLLIGEIGADAGDEYLGCDTAGATIAGRGRITRFDGTVACRIEQDTNLVVVGIGYEGMTPISQPIEWPAFELTDNLIAGINKMTGDWLGIGNLIPLDSSVQRNFDVYPLVVANAIWIDTDGYDVDGDGYPYDGPGYIPGWFEEKDVPADVLDTLGERQQALVAAAVNRAWSLTSRDQQPTTSEPSSSEEDDDLEPGGCGAPSW
ncbi:MAG: hypothetical protein GX444_16680 [Myxococcales bacterium]|nr:hypothetical protein [Myxococcales bacterium]